MLHQTTAAPGGAQKVHIYRAEDTDKPCGPCTIRVGSRKSNLALIQTNKVIDELVKFYHTNNDIISSRSSQEHNRTNNHYEFEIVAMTTTGDNILDRSLPSIGTKSLFTRELECALLNNEVDFIVHSMKDLPTTLPEGCIIGAVLPRDNVNDVLILKRSLQNKLDPLSLLQGTHSHVSSKPNTKIKVGTSSQRRIALLRRCNPNIECINIRGNLNTRFKKLDDENGEYTAIVLAAAGLDRMGMSDRASLHMDTLKDVRLSKMTWLHAVGQGAIAVECRQNDKRILDLLHPIVCPKTTYEAAAERAMMKYLEGGCSVPMGVRSTWIDKHHLELTGAVLSLNGKELVQCNSSKDLSQDEDVGQVSKLADLTGIVFAGANYLQNSRHLASSVRLGYEVALKMIEGGAKDILQVARICEHDQMN